MPQVHGNTRKDNLEPRFHEGVFLGVEETSNDVTCGNRDGVFKVRAGDMRRQIESKRWRYEKLAEVTGTPWNPVGGRSGEGGADSPEDPPARVAVGLPDSDDDEWDPSFAADADVKARRLKIGKDDVESSGPIPGCQKCQDVLAGREHIRAHSEACRQRFVTILSRVASWPTSNSSSSPPVLSRSFSSIAST